MVSFVNENTPRDYERGEIYRNKQTSNARESSIGKALQANSKYAWLNLMAAPVQKAQNKTAEYQDHFEPAQKPGFRTLKRSWRNGSTSK